MKVFIIGPGGVGKSTVGAILAKKRVKWQNVEVKLVLFP